MAKNEGLLLKVTIVENTVDPGPVSCYCTNCGSEFIEHHVECFACDKTFVGTEAELKRRGWYLSRFELCPNHGGNPTARADAWLRYDEEMTAAFGI
jgi:hypothetical protein